MEITRLALFSEFLGHLHPLLIHFPIGILLMAIVLQFFQIFSKKDFNSSISILVLIGSIFAGFACLAGWLLASSGDYNDEIVFFHRWSGIVTFSLALASYFWIRYRPFLFSVLLILIVVTGHYGSILTYGEGYFLKPKTDSMVIISTKNRRPQKKEKVQGATITYFYPYEDQIVPILKSKCYACHSIQKMKGGLRLDSEFFIQKGGKHGRILLAGNALKSHLYTYLIKPDDDDLHMPPTGKRQLTRMEIQLIDAWISSGAPFGEVEQKMVLKANEVGQVIVDLPNSDVAPVDNSMDIEALSPTENLLLDKLKDAKISIVYSGAKNQWISLNFINVKSDFNALLAQTKSIKTHVTELKLNNSDPIDFSGLRDFSNLRILNLGHTNLKDVDVENFQDLNRLEQLNLYGTMISDVGLMKLAEYPRLKVLYLWDTKVSAVGINELKKKRPKLKIETGQFTFKLADTNLNLNKRLEIK
jgi:uncharacterized membrane protein